MGAILQAPKPPLPWYWEKEDEDTNAIVIADQKYLSVHGHTLIHVTSSVGRAGIDEQRATLGGSFNILRH